MKNYNFTLTQANAGVFISRLKTLISVTGCIVTQSKYNGRQAIAGYLATCGIKRGRSGFLIHITQTAPHYSCIDNPVFEVLALSDGVSIRSDEETFPSKIKYGTKIKFTSNSIVYKHLREPIIRSERDNQTGMTTTISVCGNIKKAKSTIRMNKQYADDYWRDVEADMRKEWAMKEAMMEGGENQ